MAATWRTVRVFISSTFRDMHAERDHLVRVVFPELRERCAKRRLHLIDVDLRWGVTEEDAQRGKVLEICLREIEDCRPFFIGLLGERYGWIPPDYNVPDEEQFDWLRRLESGHSITAMEIYYGVLNDDRMQSRAFFYFRDPSFIADLPPAQRVDFQAESREHATKLQKLKQHIRDSRLPVMEDYAYDDLEVFGRRVLEDLWTAIDDEYPSGAPAPDPLDVERSYHNYLIETRTELFIGQRHLLARLHAYASGDSPAPVVVTGTPGCGKSALLAKFIDQFRRLHPDVYVLYHFIGASPSSTDPRRMLLRLCQELARQFGFDDEISDKFDALRVTFGQFVERAAQEHRLVLVIDAVNQLDEVHYSHDLLWLPQPLPASVRLIVSTLAGDALDAAQRVYPHCQQVHVTSLRLVDQGFVIARQLAKSRKRLTTARKWRQAWQEKHLRQTRRGAEAERHEIASHRQHEQSQLRYILTGVYSRWQTPRPEQIVERETANPLYLKLVAEELRLFGDFEQLESFIAGLPTDVNGMFHMLLERLERDRGRDLVEQSLAFIATSRNGLPEGDLLALLAPGVADRLPAAIWARLYRDLAFYLKPRAAVGGGDEGLLDFSHRQLAKVVNDRYLSDEDARTTWHGQLAEYYLKKADPAGDLSWQGSYPRAFSELPHHLYEGDEGTRLHKISQSDGFLAKTEHLLGLDFSRLAVQTDIRSCVRDCRLGALQEAGDTYHDLAFVSRERLWILYELLAEGSFEAARGVVGSIDDVGVRFWGLNQGLAAAVTAGDEVAAGEWFKTLESVPVGELNPAIAILLVPVLEHVSITRPAWLKPLAKPCSRVLSRLAERLCNRRNFDAATEVTLLDDMFLQHRIACRIAAEAPVQTAHALIERLYAAITHRASINDLNRYPLDYAKIALDRGEREWALDLCGPRWWRRWRHAVVPAQRADWDQRLQAPPSETALLAEISRHEVRNWEGRGDRDELTRSIDDAFDNADPGRAANTTSLALLKQRASSVADRDERLTRLAWLASCLQLSGVERQGWGDAVDVILAALDREESLQGLAQKRANARKQADVGDKPTATATYKKILAELAPINSKREQEFRQSVRKEYSASAKEGKVSFDLSLALEDLGVWRCKDRRDYEITVGSDGVQKKLRKDNNVEELLAYRRICAAEDFAELLRVACRDLCRCQIDDEETIDAASAYVEVAISNGVLEPGVELCDHLLDALNQIAEPGENFSTIYAKCLKLLAQGGALERARASFSHAVAATESLALKVSLPLCAGAAVVEALAKNPMGARTLLLKAFAETRNLDYRNPHALPEMKLTAYKRDDAESMLAKNLIEAIQANPAVAETDFIRQVLEYVISLNSILFIFGELLSAVPGFEIDSFQDVFDQIGAKKELEAFKLKSGLMQHTAEVFRQMEDVAEASSGLVELAMETPGERESFALQLIRDARDRSLGAGGESEPGKVFRAVSSKVKQLWISDNVDVNPHALVCAFDLLHDAAMGMDKKNRLFSLFKVVELVGKGLKKRKNISSELFYPLVVRSVEELIPLLPMLVGKSPEDDEAGQAAVGPILRFSAMHVKRWEQEYEEFLGPEDPTNPLGRLFREEQLMHAQLAGDENVEPDRAGGFQTQAMLVSQLSRVLQAVGATRMADEFREALVTIFRDLPRGTRLAYSITDVIFPCILSYLDGGQQEQANQALRELLAIAEELDADDFDDLVGTCLGFERSVEGLPAECLGPFVDGLADIAARQDSERSSPMTVLEEAVEYAVRAELVELVKGWCRRLSQIDDPSGRTAHPLHRLAPRIAQLNLAEEVLLALRTRATPQEHLNAIRSVSDCSVAATEGLWQYLVFETLGQRDLFDAIVGQRL